MAKKKHRQHDNTQQGYGYGDAMGNGHQQGFDPAAMMAYAQANGFGQMGAQPAPNAGFMHGLTSMFPSRNSEQFLLGLIIGAGAAWVMSDEAMRAKIIKSAMKMYAGIAGSFEEMKEQMADLKAEVESEGHEG